MEGMVVILIDIILHLWFPLLYITTGRLPTRNLRNRDVIIMTVGIALLSINSFHCPVHGCGWCRWRWGIVELALLLCS